MYGYGSCGHRHGQCHDQGYGPGAGHGPGWGGGPGWGYGRPFATEQEMKGEMIEGLEDYKASLEAEIRRLEKRIGSLREKPASE